MKLIKTKPEMPFQYDTFQIEMTGTELVILYALSMAGEGGSAFTTDNDQRIHGKISSLFPGVDFDCLRKRLVAGMIPQ